MKTNRTLKTIIASILLVVTLFTFAGCDFIFDLFGIEDVLNISATYVGEPIPIGGALNKADILVEATLFRSITGETITYAVDTFTYSPLDTATAGDKVVEVSYTEFDQTATDEITITVYEPVVFVGIEAIYVGAPLKVGESLTAENFLVYEVYSDGTKMAVTNFTFTPVDTSTAGTKQATISYTKQDSSTSVTKVVDVTVVAEPLILTSISATIDDQCWVVGYTLQKTDFVVTATFSDKHTSIVTDFTIVFPTGELTTTGLIEVELSYTYEGETRYTTVTNTVLPVEEEVANYGKYGILSDDGNSVKIIDTAKVVDTTNLQIHFLQLGNKYTGDSIYIKAGDTDILIDAGSRKGSAKAIGDYLDNYVTDGTLEYVIATHAHQDHIAGFVGTSTVDGIFERFVCENIIEFARTDATTAIYESYVEARSNEVNLGANYYSVLDCWNNNNESTRFTQSMDETGARRYIKLASNIEMEILYNYYYENSAAKTDGGENEYSVCLLINQYGENYNYSKPDSEQNKNKVNHFLFTGDLEADGEAKLVQNNDLPEVVLFKGGHHGSYTASSDALLNVIKPKVVCICCCTGTDEFGANPENTFPAQAMLNRVAKHTDMVFATSLYDDEKSAVSTPLNGDITLTCNNLGILLTASNNITLLKDTDWFKENRTCPTEWQ